MAGLTLDRAVEAERLAALKASMGVEELVYLATCNRVELYFRAKSPSAMHTMRARAFEGLSGRVPEPGEAERVLRAWAGEGAAEHLFLVATGLDSAEVGETEISGQLRRALDLSLDLDLIPNQGSSLEDLIESALKLARRIRREAHLAEGHTSLAEIAIEALRTRLAETPGPVLLIGVSPMIERTALALRPLGLELIFANRTLANAQGLAQPGETCMALADLATELPAIECLVSATAAPTTVVDAATLAQLADRTPSGAAPLVIDFAVPPDIDPRAAQQLGIERIGMEALIAAAEATRDKRLRDAAHAREAIDQALDRLHARLSEEHVAPFVSALQRRYRMVARQGAERLLATRLTQLSAEESAAVIHFAEKLAGRFAHLPSTGLRGVSRVAGAAAVDAFLARADKELAEEFALAARERRGTAPTHEPTRSDPEAPSENGTARP